MYMPPHFEETRVEVMHRLIEEHPLGMLVSAAGGQLEVNHLPFLLDPTRGRFGTLLFHVARGNPVWTQCDEPIAPMAVFQGPQAYISPNWYPSKGEHHQAVPTYNYAVVHAHGRLRVMDDEKPLRSLLARLTRKMEADQPKPWRMGDAPPEFIADMLTKIVGLELEITRLSGKWKASQNRSDADKIGAVAGLRQVGTHETIAMADTMVAASPATFSK